MRYAMFGALCASLAGFFAQAWWVVVISYAVGMILGLVLGLTAAAWERVLDKYMGTQDAS